MVPLNEVRGARSGAAIAVPLRARPIVLVSTPVVGATSLATATGLPRLVTSPAREQLGVARRTRLRTALGRRLQRRRVGLEAAQERDRVGAGDTVDGAVVHLGEDRDLARLEALDHHELPQRTRPVQRDAGHVAAQVGQLALTAGRGQRHPVHVPVDVEVVVVDPDRVVDAERHLLELAVEHRHAVDPPLELVLELAEVVAARDRRGVEHDHAADVQQLRRALQVEEARVESTEAVHGANPRRDLGTRSSFRRVTLLTPKGAIGAVTFRPWDTSVASS